MPFQPFDTPGGPARVALAGFNAARRRLDELVAPAGQGARFIVVTEALWWAQAVNESLEKVGHANGAGQSYQTARDGNDDGKLLRAIRFVRNRCGHQLALATSLQLPVDRWRGLLDGPATWLDVRLAHLWIPTWRPLSDLPPADPKFPDPTGANRYEEMLAGRPAEDTLGLVSRWFDIAVADHLT